MIPLLRAFIAIMISVSFALAADDDTSEPEEKFSEKSQCYRASEVFSLDIKSTMQYAESLYGICDCYAATDIPKARQCYDKVVTACNKIYTKSKSLDALDLEGEAMDRINKISEDTYDSITGPDCTCNNDNSSHLLIARYDEYLSQNPDDTPAWNNRGVIFGEHCCRDDALRSFDRAIEANGSAAEPWYNKGLSLYYSNPDEALSCFNRSVELNPDLALGWFNRGSRLLSDTLDLNDHSSQDAYHEARECYNKSIELDPDLKYLMPPALIFKRM